MGNTERHIYVACLASYNAGKRHGEWIDADQSAEEIEAEVRAMLRASPEPNVMVPCPEHCNAGEVISVAGGEGPAFTPCPTCKGAGKVPSAEEWAIHDHEGFAGIRLSEYESFERVAELASLLDKHGDAWAAYVDEVGEDYAAEAGFDDAYRGEWDSEEAFADDLAENVGMFEHWSNQARMYFDTERFARDLFMSDYSAVRKDGVLYVFSRNV